jgi:AAT family amino acid transporter
MILLAQIKFRRSLNKAEVSQLKFRMWLWPISSYLALAFLLFVVGLMAYFEETRIALYVGPAFLVALTVLFYVFKLAPKDQVVGAVRIAV